MKLEELQKALYACYTRDLCYPSVKEYMAQLNLIKLPLGKIHVL